MHRETQATGPQATGPLRNGNPRGNPNLAPRCGARTRAGCPCRSPAMANGRCRMHGGASTGPRTEAGRARIHAARTTHGGYGAEAKAVLRRQDVVLAQLRAGLALLRKGDEAAALGVLRGDLPAFVPLGREDPMQRESGDGGGTASGLGG